MKTKNYSKFLNFSSLIKRNFTQRIIQLEYSDLVSVNKSNNLESLSKEIEMGYGVNGLGAIIVKNVPNHFETKYKLLSQTHKLVNLSKEKLEKIERPDLHYNLGWSHGKEKFKGKPDYMKGSFYATLNPYNSEIKKNIDDSGIWPEDIPDLKTNFRELGGQIRNVSFLLYDCIDAYIRSLIPTYNLNFKQLIMNSEANTGRLLHYFARGNQVLDIEDNWCGLHNDHGGLTGLVSSLYFNSNNELVNDKLKLEQTGLWIQGRNGEYTKVTYGNNDIAFQIGEVYQILSGGRLHATPHKVVVDNDVPKDVHRSTFALFMEPGRDFNLILPEGTKLQDITTSDIYPVPKIQDRYTRNGMPFNEFHDNTVSAYAIN